MIRGFSRVDVKDNKRSRIYPEDLWLALGNDFWQVKAGYQLFNWTAMEVFHPVDVINSRNWDSDAEKLEKIGEPTISISKLFEDGSLNFYYFPRFTRPILPSPQSRMGISFELGEPVWVESTNELSGDSFGQQYGARFTWNFGEADLDLHYLRYMDRQHPRYALNLQGKVNPYFFYYDHYGLAYQHALWGMVFKAEGVYKDFDDVYASVLKTANTATGFPLSIGSIEPIDHFELALGTEYTTDYAGVDFTLYGEFQTFLQTTAEERELLSIFQRDLMLGVRTAFNDSMGKEVFVSAIVDLERDSEALFTMSYSQRLSDFWSIKTGARVFLAEQIPKTLQNLTLMRGLVPLEDSDHLYLNLNRFF